VAKRWTTTDLINREKITSILTSSGYNHSSIITSDNCAFANDLADSQYTICHFTGQTSDYNFSLWVSHNNKPYNLIDLTLTNHDFTY